MWERFQEWFKKHDRLLEIHAPNGELSLSRYYLLFKNKTERFEQSRQVPFNIFLHRFSGSDPLDLHNHPWPFISLIISGGYFEVTPQGRYWRGVGRVLCRPTTFMHRVEMPNNSVCFTIVIRGPWRREWGYQAQDGWKPWREYLSDSTRLRQNNSK